MYFLLCCIASQLTLNQLRLQEYTTPTVYVRSQLPSCFLTAQALDGGKARAVGVANYDSAQLQEMADAGMPLPAVNQIPVHLYRSSTQKDTIAYCNAHNITVNAYSPLGIPDWHAFPTK